MEIEAEESKKLPEGRHSGIICRVEYRTDPYAYTDVIITESKTGTEIKYGVPTKITKDTQLGKLLVLFGAGEIAPHQKYDPDKILIGKSVEFMTMDRKTDKGTFADVIPDSVKPKTRAQ